MPALSCPALFIGLMSGTSLDGIDGVLVDFSAQAPRVLCHTHCPMPAGLRGHLLALQQPGPDELHRAQVASHQLVQLYAKVVAGLLAQSGHRASEVLAIGAHGQTVRHHPPGASLRGQTVCADDPEFPPYTLQLNQPAWLAELTGIAVVADFRSRDIAAGGQGAPLVPAFHREIFAKPGQALAVVNIGGIANVTTLAADGSVRGWDTGPGNVLLDGWCQRHTGAAYDRDGAWGHSGHPDPGLLQRLLTEPYFAGHGTKSTGRDLFGLPWLDRHLAQQHTALAPVDVQATLLALTAHSIAQDLRPWLDQQAQPDTEVWVCGGGAHNGALMGALQKQLPRHRVSSTAEHGWPVDLVEASAFAWLAWQNMNHQPGNLAGVTGAKGPRILGGIYPK